MGAPNYEVGLSGFAIFQDELYFSAENVVPEAKQELWKYNGTTYTQVSNSEISNPEFLTVFNEVLYFNALNGSSYEAGLWRFDGFTFTQITDNWIGTTNPNPQALTVISDTLYFSAQTYVPDYYYGYNVYSGRELWKFDGTNISLVADINSGTNGSDPDNIISFQDTVYFIATDDKTGDGRQVWKLVPLPHKVYLPIVSKD